MTPHVPDLRERLLGHALDLLERTNEIPSLRGVARAAGVSAMTPYGYFSDKAALMGAVADEGFVALAASLAEADRGDDPRAALVAQGLAFVAFARARPAIFRLIFNSDYPRTDTAAAAAAYGVLRSRVASLVPSRVEAATLACRALVQGLATLVLDGRTRETEVGEVEEAIRILVAGCVALEEGGRS